MNLVMTLLVRDEEDVISANIEFHLRQGVDLFIVTDNRSRDKTTEVLRYYKRRGVLEYIYEPSDDYSQHRWVTRMARSAYCDYGADWVINNDADEFWWPEAGGSLKGLLAAVPGDVKAISAERVNFVPRQETGTGAFYETMVIRERRSLNALGRPLPPKVCHRGIKDIKVSQGNHSVMIGNEEVKAMPSQIRILHFPLRSYNQFENKIVKGGRAYERNRDLPASVGRTWRTLYESYKDGKLKSYYNDQIVNADEANRRVATGELVEDRRLAEFLRNAAADTIF